MFDLNTIDIWERKINYSRLSESATEVTEGTSFRIGESAEEKVKKVKKELIEGPDMSIV